MQSPLPKKSEKTMDFRDAMRAVGDKKRIFKLEWKDREYYGFLDDGKLRLHKPDGKVYDWIINEGDLYGDDFVILS